MRGHPAFPQALWMSCARACGKATQVFDGVEARTRCENSGQRAIRGATRARAKAGWHRCVATMRQDDARSLPRAWMHARAAAFSTATVDVLLVSLWKTPSSV